MARMTSSLTRSAAALLLAALLGCASTPEDGLQPTKADQAVILLLSSKRNTKKVRSALKRIRRYAAPPAKVVETFKDDNGMTHTETEMMYPKLGIKIFFYDGVFSGADSIPDFEKLPGR